MSRPELIDYVIAPLRWLERAKGWRRRALASAYVLILGLGGLMGWRELSLWRMPNVAEPFDPSIHVSVAPADNAMPLYSEAATHLQDAMAPKYRPEHMKGWDQTEWAVASPEVKLWVKDSRPAIETWLVAAEKPDALIVAPEDFRYNLALNPIQSVRSLARLGLLEGSRLEASGDLAGAWRMYRAALRSSRHARRHGGIGQHFHAAAIAKWTSARTRAWAQNPGQTTPLLDRAIADIAEAQAISATATEMIHAEYAATRDALAGTDRWRNFGISDDSDWTNHLPGASWSKNFLAREPERSLRVLRLIATAALAQCERPRAIRPKIRFDTYVIYDIDSKTPAPLRRVAPETLNTWAEGSALKRVGFAINYAQVLIDSDHATLDALLLDLAERAYRIDHGKPARTYADLVGSHLKALPEGVEPSDPVIAPIP